MPLENESENRQETGQVEDNNLIDAKYIDSATSSTTNPTITTTYSLIRKRSSRSKFLSNFIIQKSSSQKLTAAKRNKSDYLALKKSVSSPTPTHNTTSNLQALSQDRSSSSNQIMDKLVDRIRTNSSSLKLNKSSNKIESLAANNFSSTDNNNNNNLIKNQQNSINTNNSIFKMNFLTRNRSWNKNNLNSNKENAQHDGNEDGLNVKNESMHRFYVTRLKHSLIISFLLLVPIQNFFLFFVSQFSEQVIILMNIYSKLRRALNSIC
jgi:hypothetical protein